MARDPQGRASGFDSLADGNLPHNKLLLNLPRHESQHLFPLLVFLPLRAHEVLFDAGEPINYGYFMDSGLASILSMMEDGKSVEVGVVGREGFAGVPLLVGFESSPSRVIMQIAGTAFRVRAAELIQSLHRCPTLESRLQRYAQVIGLQSAQLAACNRLHQVEQRLARWLLMCTDRTSSEFVPLTQESLANVLGTQRSTITLAAGILQKAGSISYTPGHVRILNRAALESAACECYSTVVQQASKWTKESA